MAASAENVSVTLSRDINGARAAYGEGDVAASKAAHESKAAAGATESHAGEGGQYVKSLVLGGLDGIITTFSVVSAVAGGGLSNKIVFLMGFANLFADGISMGLGDYLSSQAELDYTAAEAKRERWEMDNYPEGEKKEMIELYMKRGMTEEDATQCITIMSKYPSFFVDVMMVEELGLMPPDEGEQPWKNGLVTFLAFVFFGFLPLLAYVIFGSVDWGTDVDVTFIISCVFTAVTMVSLGAAKARFTNQNMLRSGLAMLVNGALASCAAYTIGWAFAEALGTEED